MQIEKVSFSNQDGAIQGSGQGEPARNEPSKEAGTSPRRNRSPEEETRRRTQSRKDGSEVLGSLRRRRSRTEEFYSRTFDDRADEEPAGGGHQGEGDAG